VLVKENRPTVKQRLQTNRLSTLVRRQRKLTSFNTLHLVNGMEPQVAKKSDFQIATQAKTSKSYQNNVCSLENGEERV
jgi:hypothetical protein